MKTLDPFKRFLFVANPHADEYRAPARVPCPHQTDNRKDATVALPGNKQTRFYELLRTNRSRLLRAWFDRIANTYPPLTAKFLNEQRDSFANPVGASVSKEIGNIFDELMQEKSSQEIYTYIDGIVRTRAVQDFSASQAVALFLEFKKILREDLKDEIRRQELQDELRDFEDKIDQLSLAAFDVYMQCREKIWELKAKEAQNRTKNLLRMAQVKWRTPDDSRES
jgi:hypothetical protein